MRRILIEKAYEREKIAMSEEKEDNLFNKAGFNTATLIKSLCLGMYFSWIISGPFNLTDKMFSVYYKEQAYLFLFSFFVAGLLPAKILLKRMIGTRYFGIIAGLTITFLTVLITFVNTNAYFKSIVVVLIGILAAGLFKSMLNGLSGIENPKALISMAFIFTYFFYSVFDIVTGFCQNNNASAIPVLFIFASMFPLLAALLHFSRGIYGKPSENNTINTATATERKITIPVAAISYLILSLFVLVLTYWLASFVYYKKVLLQYQENYSIYIISVLLYFAVLLLMALFLSSANTNLVVAYSFSAFGAGFVILLLMFNSHVLNITAFLIFSVSAAGIDLFFWITIWSIARNTGKDLIIYWGFIVYLFTINSRNIFLHLLSLDILKDNVIFTITVVFMLFFSIPLIFHFDYTTIIEKKLNGTADREEGPTSIDIDRIRLLTPQEFKVLQLICRDYRYADIASELFITKNTVKFHVGNILRKTEYKSRYELSANLKNYTMDHLQ